MEKKKKKAQGKQEGKIPWQRQEKGSQEVTSGPQPAEGGVGGVAGTQVGVEPAASCALAESGIPSSAMAAGPGLRMGLQH